MFSFSLLSIMLSECTKGLFTMFIIILCLSAQIFGSQVEIIKSNVYEKDKQVFSF